jgi:Flp pilus assembly protein TadG
MANKFFSRQPDSERGQSIVLIAAAMIGLLAFVGIAVDVGFVFARNSQLQAGVDSAALAGVTELSSGNINNADDRAERFLSSNNIPISGTATMESVTYQTILQETAYSLTVTWPVELFFLRVVGWDEVTLQKSATAAFFPLKDIYAGSRVDQGKLSNSNQAVF